MEEVASRLALGPSRQKRPTAFLAARVSVGSVAQAWGRAATPGRAVARAWVARAWAARTCLQAGHLLAVRPPPPFGATRPSPRPPSEPLRTSRRCWVWALVAVAGRLLAVASESQPRLALEAVVVKAVVMVVEVVAAVVLCALAVVVPSLVRPYPPKPELQPLLCSCLRVWPCSRRTSRPQQECSRPF